MKKESRQRKYISVTFTEDFANKKAGEVCSYEPSLACNLISRKVAALTQETQKPEEKPVIKKQKTKK